MRPALRTLLISVLVFGHAAAQPLPQPAPREQPPEAEQSAPLPDKVETPPERPDDAGPDTTADGKTEPPEVSEPGDEKGAVKPDDDQQPSKPTSGMLIPPDEMACRAELVRMGASFTPRPALDEDGCGTPFPIALTGLADGVSLEPEALLNCRTALATARFIRDIVAPKARDELGKELAGVRHASAYVCRPRRDGSKMSEHARANAIDLAAFVMKDGSTIEVSAYGPGADEERAFMRRLRSAACGPFKTVLGPGTDADHADHLHLDMAERRNGSAYCR